MQLNKPITLLFILCLATILASGQQKPMEIPMLTKDQMQEDFDYFIKMINKVNPHIPFKKELTGNDLPNNAKMLFQREIENVKCFEDFYYLMSKAMSCMQDMHCRAFDAPDELISQYQHISKHSFEKSSYYISQYDRYSFGGLFPIQFIDNKYYFTMNITGINSSDTINIPSGTEIISMNSIPISKYVDMNYYLTSNLRWSTNYNAYSTKELFHPSDYKLGDSVKIQVKFPNKMVACLDLTNTNISTAGIENKDYNTFKAELLPENILYIRIPEMDMMQYDSLRSKILGYSGKQFSKVIVDVRNNPGGNDAFWINLLGLLLDKKIELASTLLFKNNEITKDYLNKYENIDINKCTDFNVPFLSSKEAFVALHDTIIIQPEMKSLNYAGKIYLLVNENCFSSALSFLSAVRGSNRFVSVGQASGWFGGRGLTPFLFCLPNSNIIFSIEPAIDITRVSSIKEIMQDKPDVEIPLNIDDYIKENSYRGERYSKEFLYNYDPTFLYVIKRGK